MVDFETRFHSDSATKRTFPHQQSLTVWVVLSILSGVSFLVFVFVVWISRLLRPMAWLTACTRCCSL